MRCHNTAFTPLGIDSHLTDYSQFLTCCSHYLVSYLRSEAKNVVTQIGNIFISITKQVLSRTLKRKLKKIIMNPNWSQN